MRQNGNSEDAGGLLHKMITTPDLILDKAKFSDWKEMYKNVWSHPESAKYMLWRVTENEEAARIRMEKTIQFQKNHDTYVVYEKASGRPIGFAGVEQVTPGICQEMGICLGPGFMGRGFGKQIVRALTQYCKRELGAREFLYFTREENERSRRLAEAMGFHLTGSEEKTDPRNGYRYRLLTYRLKL